MIFEWLSALPAELILLPPAIFLAATFAITLALRRARLSRWRAIAESTGLQLNERTIVHTPEVAGTYRGRQLTMTMASRQRGSLRFRKQWTVVIVPVANPEFISLKLFRQDVLDTVFAALGMEDLKVGNETFDRRFIVRSNEPELARGLLRAESLQNALIGADIERVEVYNSPIRAFYARDERDARHARLLFDAVVDLADAIDRLKVESKPEIIS